MYKLLYNEEKDVYMGRKKKFKVPKKSTLKSLTADEKEQISVLRDKKWTPTRISNFLGIQKFIVVKVLDSHVKKPKPQKFRNNPKALKGIYLIKNEINGKIYVGQSSDILRRWQEHILNKVSDHNKEFYKDFLEYGLPAFSFKILICHPKLTKTQLYRLENTFIKYYHATEKGYNKYYSSYNFYDLNLDGKTIDEILDFVMADAEK